MAEERASTAKRPREETTSDGASELPAKRPETSADVEKHGDRPETSAGVEKHGDRPETSADVEKHGDRPETSADVEKHGDRPATATTTSSSGPLAETAVEKTKLSFGSAGGFAAAKTGGGFGALLSTSTASEGTKDESAFSSLLGGTKSIFDAPTSSFGGRRRAFGEEDEEEDAQEDDVEAEPDTALDDQYVAVRGLTKTAVVTGEEEEESVHACKCKLYAIDASQPTAGWKERGVGNLRLLRRSSTGACRAVMRADAVLRVILNVPLNENTKVEAGGESMGDKTIRVQAVENGLPTWFAVRLGNRSGANELRSAVEKVLAGIPAAVSADPDVRPHGSTTELDAVEQTETTHAAAIDDEKDHAESEPSEARSTPSADSDAKSE